MNKIISNAWNNHHLPGMDCIIMSTGNIIIQNSYKAETGKYYSFPVCETTIESLLKYNDDIMSEIQTLVSLAAPSGPIFIAGEGAMGNEGFVACTDSSGNLSWAMYSTNSNPFHKIDIIENNLNAYSSNGLRYEINIPHPEIINIYNIGE